MSTNQNKIIDHKYYMMLALQQANINLGNTKKNPSVGCAIVKKNTLISLGSTSENGRPHAESNSINFSKTNLKGSNIYVTLEPCSHIGKTFPCTDKIIKSKIKKVFYSIKDPDKRSFDKSFLIFKKKGISVNIGVYSTAIKKFYKSYIIYKSKKLPFVISKLAVSKDLYSKNMKSKWITNEHSRSRVHLLRSRSDCILTSSKTILDDNPLLTCRIDGLEERSPTKIILDKNLKVLIKSNIIKNNFNKKTIIFYNKINLNKINLMKKKGVKLYQISLDETKNLDLEKCLIKIKELGFSRVFLESGIKLTSSFLNKNLVNEFKIFISDKKLKKKGRGNIKFFFKKYLNGKFNKLEKVNLFGDKLISYRIK